MAGAAHSLAGLLMLHQRLFRNDGWFNWHELVYHHESLIALGVVAAAGLVMGKYLGKMGK